MIVNTRIILRKHSHNFLLFLIVMKYVLFYNRISHFIKEYRAGVLSELESMINTNVCIVTEKESNFGIFKGIIKDNKPIDISHINKGSKDTTYNNSNSNTGNSNNNSNSSNNTNSNSNINTTTNNTNSKLKGYFIRKINGKLRLTKSPGDLFIASFSPFLVSLSNNQLYFYSTEGIFRGRIKKTVLSMFKHMKYGSLNEYKDDMLEYKREYEKGNILHSFKLKGSEDILETIYSKESENKTIYSNAEKVNENKTINNNIKKELDRIENLIILDKNFRKIHLITESLLEMLLNLKILKEKIDLEEYPEIIPLIFPYKIMGKGEVIKIGVDLSKVKSGPFEEFFDLESEWLKKNGLKHFRTIFPDY